MHLPTDSLHPGGRGSPPHTNTPSTHIGRRGEEGGKEELAHHSFHVAQMEEYHELDGENTDVACPHVSCHHVQVRGNMAQLEELVLARDVAARVTAIRAMPRKFVQPA